MDQSENRFYRERSFALADGGPAFPVPDRDMAHAAGSAAVMGVTDPAERDRLYADAYNKAVRGMTLRDYFIAHAPAEPQAWFQPVMEPAPNPVPFIGDMTEEERHEYHGWGDYIDTKDLKCPRVREYAERVETFTKQRAAWDREYSKQWCIQWPGAWADEQLRLRGAA